MTALYCLFAGLLMQLNSAAGQSVATAPTSTANETTIEASAVVNQPVLKQAINVLASVVKPPSNSQPTANQSIGANDHGDAADDPHTLVWVRMSKAYLADHVERSVDRKKPARNLVLGITFTGESRTQGSTRLILHPNDSQATGELEFVGTVQSRTVGQRGPATLHYLSESTFTARKPLSVSESGLLALPATATVSTRLTPTSVKTSLPGLRGRIGDQIARQRESERRPQANNVVSEHTANDIERDLDVKLNAAVAAIQAKVQTQIAELRLEDELDSGNRIVTKSRSTSEYVEVALCDSSSKADWRQAALDVTGNPDIALRVHRSVLTRAMANVQLRDKLAPALGAALVGQISSSAQSPASEDSRQLGPSNVSMQGDWLFVVFDDVSQPQPTPNIAVASAESPEVNP